MKPLQSLFLGKKKKFRKSFLNIGHYQIEKLPTSIWILMYFIVLLISSVIFVSILIHCILLLQYFWYLKSLSKFSEYYFQIIPIYKPNQKLHFAIRFVHKLTKISIFGLVTKGHVYIDRRIKSLFLVLDRRDWLSECKK